MVTTLHIETLQDRHDPRIDDLLALYERAIPARERKDAAAIRGMAQSPSHRVAVAQDALGVVGFFLLFVGERIALLEYMAVDERCRGEGLGGRLYETARSMAADRPLIVEVESDREAVPDRALRARRIGFYRRLGCRRVTGLDYILPLPGEGDPPVLDLLIDNFAAGSVPAETLAGWLNEIYAGVYGCGTDDPRLKAMIDTLPPNIALS